MSGFTKGPWLSRGKSDSVHEQSETHPFGRQIFRLADDQGPGDEDLNLILSAPELLEALEGMLAVHAVSTGINSMACKIEQELTLMARAAIARAKGEL